jgi:hypothetical protein
MAGLVAVSLLLTFIHSNVSVVVGLYPPHHQHNQGNHPPPISTSQIVDTKVLHDNWRRLIRRTVQLSSSSSIVDNNGKNTTTTTIIDFELVGQRLPDQAVLIFVWHRSKNHTYDQHDGADRDHDIIDMDDAGGTVTLIREYMPSVDAYGYGLAAGMVDDHDETDHDDNDRSNDKTLAAAQRELAEECLLERGEWYRLTPPPPSPCSDDDDKTQQPEEVVEGVVVDKYCTTKMVVYLVVDPVPIIDEHRRAAILADRDNDNAELGLQVVQVSLPQFRTECLPNMTIVANWASRLALDHIEGLLQRRPR